MVENLDHRMETLIQEVRRNNPSNETVQKPGNKGSTSEEMRVDEPALREEMIYYLFIFIFRAVTATLHFVPLMPSFKVPSKQNQLKKTQEQAGLR